MRRAKTEEREREREGEIERGREGGRERESGHCRATHAGAAEGRKDGFHACSTLSNAPTKVLSFAAVGGVSL